MSRELHCYLQKNALTVLASTDRLPFSLVPRTSSRHTLNLGTNHENDHSPIRHTLNLGLDHRNTEILRRT